MPIAGFALKLEPLARNQLTVEFLLVPASGNIKHIGKGRFEAVKGIANRETVTGESSTRVCQQGQCRVVPVRRQSKSQQKLVKIKPIPRGETTHQNLLGNPVEFGGAKREPRMECEAGESGRLKFLIVKIAKRQASPVLHKLSHRVPVTASSTARRALPCQQGTSCLDWMLNHRIGSHQVVLDSFRSQCQRASGRPIGMLGLTSSDHEPL